MKKSKMTKPLKHLTMRGPFEPFEEDTTVEIILPIHMQGSHGDMKTPIIEEMTERLGLPIIQITSERGCKEDYSGLPNTAIDTTATELCKEDYSPDHCDYGLL